MENCDWLEKYQGEVERGLAARQARNEGMARVCARRAAGVLVKAYLDQKSRGAAGANVLNNLRFLEKSPAASPEVRELAGHFLVNITPDHILPDNVDLFVLLDRLRAVLFPDC